MKEMAETLEEIAQTGTTSFYRGHLAESIVNEIQSRGGVLDINDMSSHVATFVEPIHLELEGYTIYECPPNGQGLIALLALGILKRFDQSNWNDIDIIHAQIEALRCAFAVGRKHITDPGCMNSTPEEMLDPDKLDELANTIDLKHASTTLEGPLMTCDTVYFCAVDKWGNACSFINSTYHGFGSCVIPRGLGFSLHNRGCNFSLDPTHVNCFGPHKRPYHTIIPGMAIRHADGAVIPFGVMGAFMQPQGHVQVLSNMIFQQMDPQAALDAPRFCIGVEKDAGKVYVEDHMSAEVIAGLQHHGHEVEVISGHRKSIFGRGQVIVCTRHTDDNRMVICAGSDPRADGCAVGY